MAVSSGVYGLIGVTVGGGITWGTQWALAARTDRLDARIAKRKVRAELRRHRQTVWHALSGPASVETLAEFYVIELEQVGTKAWTEYSDRLPRQLSDADWDTVEAAYESIADLIWRAHQLPTRADAEDVKRHTG